MAKERNILLIVQESASKKLVGSVMSKFSDGDEILIIPEKFSSPILDFLKKTDYVLSVTNSVPMDLVDFIICICESGSSLSESSEERANQEEKLMIKVIYP